jgi:histone deacetylase HOS3
MMSSLFEPGNGTQSITWSINEDTYRQALEVEEGVPKPTKLGPKIYYGSIHDILSYPCEVTIFSIPFQEHKS